MTMRILLLLSLMIFGVAPASAADTVLLNRGLEISYRECCGAWVKHLEADGFTVKVNAAEPSTLASLKRQAGIGDRLASCHTAKFDGYVIEGHVPGTEIKRPVAERPEAIGLAVPGMPVGSPGMEQGAEFEPYDVLLIKKDGSTEIFASH